MLIVLLLHVLFRVLLIVRGDVLGLLDSVHRLGPRVPNRHATFFRELVHDLHELFPPLFGQRRDRNPNNRAVIGRSQPEIGCEDSLLHGFQQSAIPRLYRQEFRLRRGDARHLRERHFVAVSLDAHQVEQRCCRLARAHSREFALYRLDRLVHQLFGVLHMIGETGSWCRSHWTIVPTRSPARTLAVAPGWLMLNTMMGSLFSLHNPNALASITA